MVYKKIGWDTEFVGGCRRPVMTLQGERCFKWSEVHVPGLEWWEGGVLGVWNSEGEEGCPCGGKLLLQMLLGEQDVAGEEQAQLRDNTKDGNMRVGASKASTDT